MIIMVLYLQVNELLKLSNEFLQVDKKRVKENGKNSMFRFFLKHLLIICRHLLFLLDNSDRQRWQRIYVEGPTTGTLGRSLFIMYSRKILYYSF
jgi:hypothetical protein